MWERIQDSKRLVPFVNVPNALPMFVCLFYESEQKDIGALAQMRQCRVRRQLDNDRGDCLVEHGQMNEGNSE
jgi:hypothetical protein